MAQMCVGQPGTPTNVVWKGGLVRNLPDRDQQGGVRNPIEVLDHRAKCFKEGATILVALIDRLATITAGSDMVKRAGKLESQRPGHPESIA